MLAARVCSICLKWSLLEEMNSSRNSFEMLVQQKPLQQNCLHVHRCTHTQTPHRFHGVKGTASKARAPRTSSGLDETVSLRARVVMSCRAVTQARGKGVFFSLGLLDIFKPLTKKNFLLVLFFMKM